MNTTINIDNNNRNLFIKDVVAAMKIKGQKAKIKGKKMMIKARDFFNQIKKDQVLYVACMGGNASVFCQYDGYEDLYVLTGDGPNNALDICEFLGMFNMPNVVKIDAKDLVDGFNGARGEREIKKQDSQMIFGKMKARYHKGMKAGGIIKRRDRIDHLMNAHLNWIERGEAGRMTWKDKRAEHVMTFLAFCDLIKYAITSGGFYIQEANKRGVLVDKFISFGEDQVVLNNLLIVIDGLRYHMIHQKKINQISVREITNIIVKVAGEYQEMLCKSIHLYKTSNKIVDDLYAQDFGKLLGAFFNLMRDMVNMDQTFRDEFADQLCDNPDLVDDMNPQELYELGYLMENEMPIFGDRLTEEQIDLLYMIAKDRCKKEIEKDAADIQARFELACDAACILSVGDRQGMLQIMSKYNSMI